MYVSVPFAAAVLGWFTKIVAVKMIFYPVEFKGIRPYLGWQGQIPKHAAKMAGIAIDSVTSKVLRPEELFARIDPDELAKELEGALHDATNEIVEAIMTEYQPRVWAAMPRAAKRAMVANVERRAPAATRNMLSVSAREPRSGLRSEAHGRLQLGPRQASAEPDVPTGRGRRVQVPDPIRPVLRLLHRIGSGDCARDHRIPPRAAVVRADHGRADRLRRADDDLPPQGEEADRTGTTVARPVP